MKIANLLSALREIIEPDVNLFTRLLSKGVLTFEQFQNLCSQNTMYQKNDRLLEYLLDERYTGDYSEVMDILRETDQDHVVNFITSNGSKYFVNVCMFVNFRVTLAHGSPVYQF
jgi:hypothetical protein